VCLSAGWHQEGHATNPLLFQGDNWQGQVYVEKWLLKPSACLCWCCTAL